MLERMDELTNQRKTFAIETTLAGRGHAQRLRRMKEELGYSIELIFVWLPSADFAVDRVANRVRQGGHDIPEPVIRRRFDQGIKNFQNQYALFADRWAIIDGTWYPSQPIVLHENNRSVPFYESAVEAIRKYTPGLLSNESFDQTSQPNRFFDQLESASDEASQAIVEAARRIPVPIVVWRDGELLFINSITERSMSSNSIEDAIANLN